MLLLKSVFYFQSYFTDMQKVNCPDCLGESMIAEICGFDAVTHNFLANLVMSRKDIAGLLNSVPIFHDFSIAVFTEK